jgi:hypothetical protein
MGSLSLAHPVPATKEHSSSVPFATGNAFEALEAI